MPYFPPDNTSSPGGSGGGTSPPIPGPGGVPPGGNDPPPPSTETEPFPGLTTDGSLQPLLEKAVELESLGNYLTPLNYRYRGPRESQKFNLMIQQITAVSAFFLPLMRSAEGLLKSCERSLTVPTNSEIAVFYHIREQLRFKEYLLLKDSSVNWFL